MASSAAASDTCKIPAELLRLGAPLPGVVRAFTTGGPIRIFALGSSSTAGAGASAPSKSYPAMLQADLRQRFPGRQIEVRNLGIGGQLASQMLPRITRDVLPQKPSLVLWQTGVNDVIARVKVADFKRTLVAGIDMMKAAGIDVVLIDQQYYPKARSLPQFAAYVVAMREAAAEKGIPVLKRYAMMEQLIASHQFAAGDLLASDGFHLNDRSYACLGAMIADALQDTIRRPALATTTGPAPQPVAVVR